MFNQETFLNYFKELLAIDSPTALYGDIQEYVLKECAHLGYQASACHKGGVIAESEGEGDPLLICAHLDTIGLMVRHINNDGTLHVCRIGGLYAFNCTGENVRVYTHTGKIYNGTVCRTPNSIHVTESELRQSVPDFETNACVVLDEDVCCAADVRALGIESGDIIALDHRFTLSNGFIKSRFIDDKACAAVLLALMENLAGKNLPRKVRFYFTVYEEIGHGSAYIPEDTKDIIAVDIAPTGSIQTSDEHKVSIFSKSAKMPYHWYLTDELRDAAVRSDIRYAMDVFTPRYSSDAETPVLSGYDVRFAALGPGTANSHGYERTHMDAIEQTYRLLEAYITEERNA